jgi:hypothetical protein
MVSKQQLGTLANHLQPIGAQEGKEFKEKVYCSNRGMGLGMRMFSEVPA